MGAEITAAQINRVTIEEHRLAGPAFRILGKTFRGYAVHAVTVGTNNVLVWHTSSLYTGTNQMGSRSCFSSARAWPCYSVQTGEMIVIVIRYASLPRSC